MASLAPQTPDPRRIGRFELVRTLGKGTQGTVHLARDTHLDRSVALKTLRLDGADAATRARRAASAISEARLASQLSHPNIVTLHDALEEGGAPCLVFEYVPGKTLAELLKPGAALEPARAVHIALDVLRALACAHAKGIVHRDLKPANILLTEQGTARVMDFGIARRLAGAEAESGITGTPGYLAPEYLESRRPEPSNDIFALGVTLHEMLTGERLFPSGQVFESLHRIASGKLVRPSERNAAIDERLDAIVMQALCVLPAHRYTDAEAFAAALCAYLDPVASSADPAGGTLEFLLRRMRHKSDFPALSSTVAQVNRALADDREPIGTLCGTILKDFALTNKLLRLVNAALYSQFGGSISTVSRAVSILGFEGVRGVTLTLMLLEHLQNKAQASALREEVAAVYFAGVAARELAQRIGGCGTEEAFVCAMFHRLGRLLALFYLHDEAQAVQRLIEARGIDEHRASREVLGISYDQLGLGVARQWNFPDTILDTLPAVREATVTSAQFASNRHQVLAELACALTDATSEPDEAARSKRMGAVAARFGRATGSDVKALCLVADEARKQFSRDAPGLGLGASRLAATLPPATQPEPPGTGETIATLVEDSRLSASVTATTAEAEPKRPANRRAMLAAGVQDITQALAGDFVLNDVLRIILETAYRAMGFRRTLLFIRDAKSASLRCRLGFGPGAAELAAEGFAVPLAGTRDIFAAALAEGADLCIADIEAERIREHVPAWFRSRVTTRGLVLFPIHVKKRPVALIYADADDPALLTFDDEELSLLKTLRNQAVLAVRASA